MLSIYELSDLIGEPNLKRRNTERNDIVSYKNLDFEDRKYIDRKLDGKRIGQAKLKIEKER